MKVKLYLTQILV